MRAVAVLGSMLMCGIVAAQTPVAPNPTPAPTPAPSVSSTLDVAVEGFIGTGEWSFGTAQVTMASPAAVRCLLTDQPGYAREVLKFVYAHRLGESGEITDQMVIDLIGADPTVAQQYASLATSGTLTTDATVDLSAVLNHAALLENYGASGTVTGQGSVLTSGYPNGPWCPPLPPACRNDLGGIIWWGNEPRQQACFSNGWCNRLQEAMVFLTIVRPNGTTYRAVTQSQVCGCPSGLGQNSTSGYAFANVPEGAATVIARPIVQCCKMGTTTRAVMCPPGPRSYRPCVPIAPTVVADITMGPWTPPGVCGRVTNPPALTEVFFGTKESSCTAFGTVYLTPQQPDFFVRSCLPSNAYLYARSGTMWAESDIPDTLSCGEVWPPSCLTLTLTEAPCFSGSVTNWQACMNGHYFVRFEGCVMGQCNIAAMVCTAGVQPDGTFDSSTMLAPGMWDARLIYVPNPQNPSVFYYAGTFPGQWPVRLAAGERCHPLLPVTAVVHCN